MQAVRQSYFSTRGRFRTDLGKCTHQCYEKQGNNNTRALSTKKFFEIVFFGCKKIDRQPKKKEVKKRIDKKELIVN